METGIDLDEAAGAGRREQLSPAGHRGRWNPGPTSSPSGLPGFPAAFLAGDTGTGAGTGSGTSQTFPGVSDPFLREFGAPNGDPPDKTHLPWGF